MIFSVRFRERWDCLSEEATDFILTHLRPRLVLSGAARLPVYSLALYCVSASIKKIPPRVRLLIAVKKKTFFPL
jgi:hypothetical protein